MPSKVTRDAPMRIDRHLAIAITTVFVLQGVLCPAVCLAGGQGTEAASQERAAADSDQSSHEKHPCHQGQGGAPEDVPSHGDDSPECTSCGAESTLIYTVEKELDPPSAAIVAATSSSVPAAITRVLAPVQHQDLPPPARLYLLNSSFLI